MRQPRSISEEKVNSVKDLIKQGLSLRNCASLSAVSFYTAWCISKGAYDTTEPLQSIFKNQDQTLFYHTDKMFI